MSNKYRYVDAVGQINSMACWAASLKWWYKAMLSINASQTALWNRYQSMQSPQGGMTDAAIKHIIGENAMTCVEFTNASTFTVDNVKGLLECGPLYVAYTESGTQKKHVNVIYGVSGSGPWADVLAMEPQATAKNDGSFRGKHEKKSLSDFNILGTVYCGVHRANYNTWSTTF